ncbi:NifU family protein [bacterium]|nr:NifU family protein [bacterium]
MNQVIYESTPNPQALRFIVTAQPLADRTQDFKKESSLSESPLAQKLFGFPWCAGVLISPQSVTITKEEWVDWETLADPLAQIIQEHVESGLKSLLPKSSENEVKKDFSDPLTQKIFSIIENEIRPAVSMDGGDIIFQDFKEGVVYLHMLGACSGCPSSTYTLKEGIETRLKEAVPEVKEVIAI